MIQVAFSYEPSVADLVALACYLGILVAASAVLGSGWYK